MLVESIRQPPVTVMNHLWMDFFQKITGKNNLIIRKQICILQISGDAPLIWKMKEKKYYITGKIPSIDSEKMKKREFPMNNRKNYLYIP